MPGRRWHLQHHRQITFFRHPDDGRRLGQAAQNALGDQQPLVDHEFKAYGPLLEQCRNTFGTTLTTDLFVRTKRQVNGAPGLETAGRQHLDSLHLGDQVALVVPGTASPDKTVFDDAAKGIHGPVFLCSR